MSWIVTVSSANLVAPSTLVGPPQLTNAIGDVIVYVTGEGGVGNSPPAAPSGYSANKSPNVNQPDKAVYLRIATAINESPPTVNWNVGNTSYAFATILHPPSGFAAPSLSTIVNAAVDWANSGTVQINYATVLTPTVPNCLLLAFGHRIKSATSNGASIGSMLHDTAFGSPILAPPAPNGSSLFVVANAWQQTTATPTNTADGQTISITDANLNAQSVMLAFLPPVPVPMPLSWPRIRRVHSTSHYPR